LHAAEVSQESPARQQQRHPSACGCVCKGYACAWTRIAGSALQGVPGCYCPAVPDSTGMDIVRSPQASTPTIAAAIPASVARTNWDDSGRARDLTVRGP
jgi:hypothetical protein